ncbi:gluconokinase [Marinimicrobium alkaliphilum]|uniref:gluconokinase n=1 Tax=Marinimicrobium alkaliphilum TaxID=2202654 RepID=UPI000DB9A2AD|nr:gluconokinase, GntK/IdnK-type [Marinimicrobium alkaliphilum]
MTSVLQKVGKSNRPILAVVMGVSGCGKSTLGHALAKKRDWCYLDADDFHSAQSRDHMASGKPLTDEMRKPWISAICQRLRLLSNDCTHTVLAFSGLKKAHREPLRHCGFDVIFLHLAGDREIVAQRLQARTDHFMPVSLLDSQLAALEAPENEGDVCSLAIDASINDLLDQSDRLVEQRLVAAQGL